MSEVTLKLLLDGVCELENRCRELLIPLSEDQKYWAPAESWSAIQCLDHMNRIVESYLPGIREAIRRGHMSGIQGEEPYTLGFLEDWFLKTMEPPVGFRFHSPKTFRPSPQPRIEDVQQKFFFFREDLRQTIRSAAGLDLRRIKLPFPAASWFRISLGAAFATLLAHDRRHFRQIEQLTRRPGFPPDEPALEQFRPVQPRSQENPARRPQSG